MFDKSLHVTNGHDAMNNCDDDSSVAYWFHTSQIYKFPPLPPVPPQFLIDHRTVVPSK